MLAAKLKLICAVALVLCFVPPVVAQQPAPSPQYVENTGFKNRIFEVKYRDPESLESVIKLLTSGFKGASISANRTFRTLTVRDFPENIAAIEDALKRLDTPEAQRPEIELRIHVLIAGNAEGGNPLPTELRDVVGQLQSTLSYKNYNLLTSIIQRAKEQPYSTGFLQGEGQASITTADANAPRNFNYAFSANSLTLGTNPAGATTVQLGGFNFRLAGGEHGNAVLRSDVGLRDGEKVVVGTAGLKDKALILVLTAKLIK